MRYTIVRNKYLADGLAFCGFKYLKYTNEITGKVEFSFEETDKLKEAIYLINQIRINNK